MPTQSDIRATVITVLEHAEKLREAGVLTFTLDGLSVVLAPLPVEHTDVVEAEAKPERPRRMWDEPALYGRDDDAPVPKLKKEQ